MTPEKNKDGSPEAGSPTPAASVKTWERIAKEDTALNKRAGWAQDSIRRLVEDLIASGRVEVGWRESCGTTDPTHYIYRAWLKIIPMLKKDGFRITEEPQKHGNGWATKGGGFWNSIIYRLATPEESSADQTVKDSLTVPASVSERAEGATKDPVTPGLTK